MKKAWRIKTDKDYQRVYHQGRSIANRQLVLYFYPKPEQTHYRVGLSVGKRLGNAVQRNQIKRYLRRAVHELTPAIAPNYDFLLIARHAIVPMNYHEVKRSLIHVMNLAHVIDTSQVTTKGGHYEKK